MRSPQDIFRDCLGEQDKETRVAVVIDSDLSFRLRFRDALAKGRTAIVLSRGAEAMEPIDVSFVADILSKNEAGEPLDLSVTAFFRRVAPKINFPAGELRRFKGELLTRLEHVQAAAEKVIQR